jgi:hypothetical protein
MKNWIDNPNPNFKMDYQSQSNLPNWIAIRIEQSSNALCICLFGVRYLILKRRIGCCPSTRIQVRQWVWWWRRCGSPSISGGHGNTVNDPAGVEVALKGVRMN